MNLNVLQRRIREEDVNRVGWQGEDLVIHDGAYSVAITCDRAEVCGRLAPYQITDPSRVATGTDLLTALDVAVEFILEECRSGGMGPRRRRWLRVVQELQALYVP